MIEPAPGPAVPPAPTPAAPVPAAVPEHAGERFGRAGILLALLTVSLLFVDVVQIFVTPVVLAAVFAGLAYPVQARLVRRLRGRRGPAALLSCVCLVVGVAIPIYVAATFATSEVVDLYNSAQLQAGPFAERIRSWVLTVQGSAQALPVVGEVIDLLVKNVDWSASAQDLMNRAGDALASMINSTSRNAALFVANVFIILFTMFYFFRDGEEIVSRLRALSPLDSRYEEVLLDRLVLVSRGTLRGYVVVGVVQSTIAAFTLWVCGVRAPFLWWLVMVLVSVIPMVGSYVVMYPMALVQLLGGHLWQAALIIAVAVLVISNIDNFLRPRLVGRHAKMHDLLVFFSTLGGISVYGVMGFIVGPIIAAVFLALLDIYALEFKPHLARAAARGRGAATDVATDVR